ncbi:hypothetical protein FRX31_003477 [Thalictrum thalictroides]|uniref:Uncharacterized protein n=1 Tax=Thalictrum thalictroides TaxID=46969 RepID=A0A7J6XAW5_THATH|nr:hypothetical protein FRX31_003477 [Thalictrum thalictroides]
MKQNSHILVHGLKSFMDTEASHKVPRPITQLSKPAACINIIISRAWRISKWLRPESNMSLNSYLSQRLADPTQPESEILLSGCQANDASADMNPIMEGNKAYGSFSNAVQMVLKDTRQIIKTRSVLLAEGFINTLPNIVVMAMPMYHCYANLQISPPKIKYNDQ